jgi:hypothetical protein
MHTLEELITTHGVDVHEHLDRQVTVPVLAGLQRQGDVIIIPVDLSGGYENGTQVPAEGYPVVRGESGGNTHLLLAAGAVSFHPAALFGSSNLSLGILTVAEGATAYLAHPEHAYTGIAPGTYEIRRQREQADEIRMVQD